MTYRAIFAKLPHEIRSIYAGHGVQMECSREKAIAILQQQLQGLNGNMHTMKGELEASVPTSPEPEANSLMSWTNASSAWLSDCPCCMQVLERRLLIAEAALQAPLQGGHDMMDIREEEDVTLLSGEPSHIDAYVFPSSSAAPDNLLPDDSQSEHLALEGSEGAKSGRRRSVTFAEAPMVEGPGRGGQPGSPGLRKGFFGKPKPVLKRTSSISGDSSSPVDRAVQEQRGAADPAGAQQAQSRVDEARDEAFSGHIVERFVSPGAQLPQTHTRKDAAAGQVWGESQSEALPDERQRDNRKVSRFRQQRQKPA